MIATFDTCKKSNGQWKDEPDKLQWIDEKTGLDCLIVRNPNALNLCGYVGVPKTHPLYKKGYSDCFLPSAKKRGFRKGDDKPIAKGLPKMPKRILDRIKEKMVCNDSYCDHTPDSVLDVHGGITFSDICQKDEDGICHIAELGANEPVWWFGFDCAHAGDFIPGFEKLNISFMKNEIYKNIKYVIDQTEKLAKQLKGFKFSA